MSNHPQRILQISAKAPSWGFDLFRQIDIGLTNQGHDVTTVFLGKAKDNLSDLDYRGEVILLGIDKNSLFWRLKVFLELLKLCRKKQFTTIIAHHYKPSAIAAFTEYFCNIKQAFMVNHNPGNLRRKGRRLVIKYLFSKRWKFITVSDWVRHDFLEHAPWLEPEHVIRIYNCIDIDGVLNTRLGRSEARNRLDLPADAFVFGNIHRLDPSKGHDYMIKAFAEAFAGKPEVHLIIIGGGDRQKMLMNLAREHQVEAQVHLPGLIANASSLTAAFDCFVVPSLHEGFGLGLLEGMAASIPVIASDGGALPEVLGEAGMIFHAGDVSALSHCMDEVYKMTSEQQKEMGIAALERLTNMFSPAEYHAQFQKLISQEPGGDIS